MPMGKGGRQITLGDLEVLPPVAWGEQRIGLVNQYHDLARTSMAQSCSYMILAGAELLALKKDAKHGEWEKLFIPVGSKSDSVFAFAMTVRSAQRYMVLAGAAKKHIPALQAICNSNVPLALMPPEQREALVQAVRKAGDGKTYSEAADEYGIAKKKRGAASTGGRREAGDVEPKSKAERAKESAEEASALIMGLIKLHWMDDKVWALLDPRGDVSQERARECIEAVRDDMIQTERERAARAGKGGRK